ncbi:CHAT domain-containing protein [Haliscomenobacter sp.]|uniref:CHAT domain-containing protein n=1 Tax=Haliscomenobacter sp. TaxID=2717303 RepID=UPI003BA86EEF
MRNCLWMALCLITGLLSAQTVDSVALRRVDSLLRRVDTTENFSDALRLNTLAENIALEKIGRESAAYARCCHSHYGLMLRQLEIPDQEAFNWASEALRIRKKVLGKQHASYAISLSHIAYCYMSWGQHEKALPYLLEGRQVMELPHNQNNTFYTNILVNLGVGYIRTGQYEQGEEAFLSALAYIETHEGSNNRKAATVLNNLATLNEMMGNYPKSLQYALKSTERRRLAVGEKHYTFAFSLKTLAMSYLRVNNIPKAEEHMLEARSIVEKTVGKESGNYPEILEGLATIYARLKQFEKAESLLNEACGVRAKLEGYEHPGYGYCLSRHAAIYIETGALEHAESLLQNALRIAHNSVGEGSEQTLEALRLLAALYQMTGRYVASEALFNQLTKVLQFNLSNALHHLSEQEMQRYFRKEEGLQDAVFSLIHTAAPKLQIPPGISGISYNNTLFLKGFLLQSAISARQLATKNPAHEEMLNLLKSYERRLGDAYSKPFSKRDSSEVVSFEMKKNELQKQLAREVDGYTEVERQVSWQAVQKSLHANAAAIEFVHFNYYNKSIQFPTDSVLYAALVLLPGTDAPEFIPLFEEKQLTTLLKTEGNPQPAFYNDLYANDKKGDQLYDLIWKPISAALPQGTTVYCSPSGLLHRLNLGAIPTPDGKTLAEKTRLSILGSTRQLVIPPVPTTQQSATAQLYGGIQYDATPTVAANTSAKPEDLAARRGPDITQNDSTLRGENWNYLRWTEVEISAAANVMKSKSIVPTLKKGAEATEESFKALGHGSPSPRILHLATHGFFFPDPKESKPGEGQAIGEKTFKVSDNPMIRSGLVLAGGNHAWKTGKPLRPDLEDGILTAYEISQMNLANTELVVLSACETGLGDLVGNEGVYGLQRAFKIAGARYLIMSLWQVPDFQTQVFMTAFYKHWLEGKMAVPEAFRATQAELRGRYSGEAFKWAGFVLVE